MGRYCSYLLPKQAGGTSQILVFKTLQMTSRPALYVFFTFHHRFKSNYYENGLGFELAYKSSDVSKWTHRIGACNSTFTTQSGLLTSPSYPEKYPKNADCIYTISRPRDTFLNLKILTFDVYHYLSCKDYLEIRDGSSEGSQLIGKFCGSNLPAFLPSTKNQVWMK